MDTKGIVVVLVCLLAWAVCADAQEPNEPPQITLDAHWSIEGGIGLGASGEDLLQGLVMYWPDYADDGAIGVMFLGGDQIPENHFAAGPAIEFPLGPVYDAVTDTVLPDRLASWFKNVTAPIRPTGLGALLGDEKFNPIGVAGTRYHLWPDKRAHPIISTEYINPSGNSSYGDLEGFWTFVDLVFLF